MLRRLYPDQPASFAFTPENQAWAEAQITKFPEGRQASAVIPILWRAHEQEGWLTRPAIEYVADMLGMARIRALEVASFYFMFQLQPVGSVAHIQICGTTSCMICGAEDLMAVCQEKIAVKPHELSKDGKFSWEEVECVGACANAPVVQIGKDYYEDLTAERLREILDELAAGKVPLPGPQNGRYAAEPLSGLTTLESFDDNRAAHNASVQRAADLNDTIRRIDGSEQPLTQPWHDKGARHDPAESTVKVNETPVPILGKPSKAAAKPDDKPEETASAASPAPKPAPEAKSDSGAADAGAKPETLDAPRGGKADNLKLIKGVGPKLEALLNRLGFHHFDQIAAWSDAEVRWVDQNLEGFKGRVSRDEWVKQAKTLAKGGETEFASRVKKGDVY
ncbi:NADH-quinone oxidoreductase subunit E [Roseovarius spongiae]|uniref:NADH-quinone oxidoreductase subunit E n=1 Tax=Roseovarius spongiae TaxID=2320272 RepID=A0A3A8B3A4_9RHOB|nr:NADH-quinone oxidoreductase subunit E [Roseovarius spongiae]RKF15002.1 NADH-quinone oxidoreductase subunit E [Roseovarius spongiae]